MLNIAINGFGRIGRLLYRALIDRQAPVNIVAVHDVYDVALAQHLLAYDSHYGSWSQAMKIKDNRLLVANQSTKFLQKIPLGQLPWQEHNVDLVIEASGKNSDIDSLKTHLTQGARRVLLTTSNKHADRTVIFGVNQQKIKSTDRILSAASCTSNCLVPLIYVLQNNYRLLWGQFLTVHAHTNDQQLLDAAHKDWYRARSAGVSIIPTSTHASDVSQELFPQVPMHGSCLRVPVSSVSVLHLNTQLQANSTISLQHIQDLFVKQAQTTLSGIVDCSRKPLVSIDYKGCPHSAVLDMASMHYHTATGHLSLSAWYDNEWGYVQRLVDIILYIK